jgi:hypothetical protein
VSAALAGIKAVLSSARKIEGIVKWAEGNPGALARFEESSAAATREMLKDSYAAVKAMIAFAMDRDPSDEEVDAVFTEAVDHPNAPFRFHRLLGEARKSASRRRRRFLASVFFGLEFSTMPDDERDRVDLVVERMVPADVELLMRVDEMNRISTAPAQVDGPHIFQGTRVTALLNGIDVRIATTDDYDDSDSDSNYGFEPRVFVDDRFQVDQAAFGSLVSLGCLDIGESKASQMPWEHHRLMITELGRLVVRAIEEVRSGFETSR